MGQRGRKPREIMLKQIEQIGDLYFNKKLTMPQIAELLKIDSDTVFRNVNKYREKVKITITKNTAEEHLIHNISNKWKVIQRAWIDYENADKYGVKAAFLGLISRTEDDILSLLERLRLIDKPVERLDVRIDKYEEDLKWLEEHYYKKILESKQKRKESSEVQSV